jgi:hypothetical protein
MSRAPSNRTILELAVAKRGRDALAKRSDGHGRYSGGAYSGDATVGGFSIMSSQGDLMIERISDYRMIYAESPNGHVLRTSLESELAEALNAIDRALVLEDLADV